MSHPGLMGRRAGVIGTADKKAVATATELVARLREQADGLRAEIARLRTDLAVLHGDYAAGRNSDLAEANGALVLSALQAETIAESTKGALDELTRSSQRDALTETPNRAVMLDRMESAIALSCRRGTQLALLFLDLDQFKQINDTLGHAVGDEVLRLAARRMESAVRGSDTVSRHSGDEFLILLAEISHPADAGVIASKVLLAIAEPGTVRELSASIGIAIYPEDGTDAADLIANADAAMYRSKRRGPGGFAFHSE